jgi:hypothetical protein
MSIKSKKIFSHIGKFNGEAKAYVENNTQTPLALNRLEILEILHH